MPTPEPFPKRLKTLASEKGLSVAQVGYKAFDLDVRGTNPNTLNKVMQGKTRLNDALARAVATVLGVPPETFTEYRLSRLRHDLDEAAVGFDDAAAKLALIEAALRQDMTEAAEERAGRGPRHNGAVGEGAPDRHGKALGS
jgi:transcriptional regulator with XRE-family HTH domain